MDEQFIKIKLLEWMKNFVESPHSFLSGWAPCPYAKAARLNNRIEIIFSSVENLKLSIIKNLHLLDIKDVLIVCFDHTLISSKNIEQVVNKFNKELMLNDYVILEDHPEQEEILNSVKMNFGYCGLLLIQRLSKLNKAAEQLKNQGYYDCWPKENLDDVVNWRYAVFKN